MHGGVFAGGVDEGHRDSGFAEEGEDALGAGVFGLAGVHFDGNADAAGVGVEEGAGDAGAGEGVTGDVDGGAGVLDGFEDHGFAFFVEGAEGVDLGLDGNRGVEFFFAGGAVLAFVGLADVLGIKRAGGVGGLEGFPFGAGDFEVADGFGVVAEGEGEGAVGGGRGVGGPGDVVEEGGGGGEGFARDGGRGPTSPLQGDAEKEGGEEGERVRGSAHKMVLLTNHQSHPRVFTAITGSPVFQGLIRIRISGYFL